MKHARKTAVKKKTAGRMPKKWKIIVSTSGGILGVAVIFLAYLYFPIVSGFIDRGIDYLFKLPNDTLEQEEVIENNAGETSENDPEEEIKEEEPEEIPEEISEENGEEEAAEQDIAPTIKLTIYEGPLYSKSDDICYYRVVAEVTGYPYPEIIFNKDDSLGSLGPGKVQINLKRDSQSFVLNATAENSEGKSSDSMTLNWNCNRSPDISGISLSTDTLYINEQYEISVEAIDLDGDILACSWSVDGGSLEDNAANPAKWNTPAAPGDYTISVKVTDGAGNESLASMKAYVGEVVIDQTPENMNVPKKENEGGYIEYGGVTSSGGGLYAGDSENNKPCSGFISFDISSLGGRTIEAAVLTLSGASISGDPLGFFDTLWVNVLDWGAEPINQNDFALTGIAVASYDSPNITCNVSKLKEEIQKAINAGKSRFQIRIHFGGAYTDDDGNNDGWGYSQSKINLNITMSP